MGKLKHVALKVNVSCLTFNHGAVLYLNPAQAELRRTQLRAVEGEKDYYEVTGVVHFKRDEVLGVIDDEEVMPITKEFLSKCVTDEHVTHTPKKFKKEKEKEKDEDKKEGA